MMQHWLTATVIAICIGLALYACVRLRMHFGPIVRKRWGNWARRAYWMMTILVMVAFANLGLLLLRIYLGDLQTSRNGLMLEIWFALLSAAVALGLILQKLKRRP
jgi:hypothetical protein